MVGDFPYTFSLKLFKHVTYIGATVDNLGVDEGGPLGCVEHLVDLLAPGRLPER